MSVILSASICIKETVPDGSQTPALSFSLSFSLTFFLSTKDAQRTAKERRGKQLRRLRRWEREKRFIETHRWEGMGGEGRRTGGLRHPGKAKARDVYGGEPLAPSVACEGLYTAVTSGLQINRPPARKCTHDAHLLSRHVTNAAFDVFASLSTGLTQSK